MRSMVLATLGLALVGCENLNSTLKELVPAEGGAILVTSADVRTIQRITPDPDSPVGRVKPNQITCTEPSPDVAKAISASFGAGGALSLQGLPANVAPEVAAAVAKSQAESLAQLGERLGTIQLLRDALFRACEAYANGAISDTTYTILVSRYDDVMVTLLASELAGGAFGRRLAALTGETSADSGASLDASQKVKRSSQLLKELETKRNESRELSEKVARLNTEERKLSSDLKRAEKGVATLGEEAAVMEADTSLPRAESDAKKAELAKAQQNEAAISRKLDSARDQRASLEGELKQVENSKRDLETELSVALESSAKAVAKAGAEAGGGIEAGKQGAEVAESIANIQRQYINNINADALAVACISALDKARDTKDMNALAYYCYQRDLITKLMKGSQAALMKRLETSGE